MYRAKMWCGPLRYALLAPVMLMLLLACFMFASMPAHAATRQAARVCPSLKACGGEENTCLDPQQITLACLDLNVVPPNTMPKSSVQNPIASGSTLFFLTSPADTVEQTTIQTLWSIMLGVVDVCGALMLIISGIYIMVGGTVFRYAKALETIPGTLLALVAAHISLIFIGTLLGLNNAVVYDVYQWAETNISVPSVIGTGQPQVFLPLIESPQQLPAACYFDILEGQALVPGSDCWGPNPNPLSTIQITPQSLDFTNWLQNITSLSNMLPVIVKIMSLMLLAQVIIRLFFIDLYIVLAPVGIACWALPGRVGQPLTRLWVRGFVSTMLVQFVQVMALILVEATLPALFNYFSQYVTNQTLQPVTLAEIFNIALLWFVFRVPSLFETAPMRTLIAAGQAMSAVVEGTIASQVAIVQAGLSFVGGVLSFLH